MQVNDLIEFLEYCDRKAPVSVGLAAPDGEVVTCSEVRFLQDEGRVYLIVDDFPKIAAFACKLAKMPSGDVSRSEYDSPQVFGKQLLLLRRDAADAPPQ